MGRETTIEARLANAQGVCTVHLEAHALILRGMVRATLPLTTLSALQVRADGLHGTAPQGALWLGLSQRMAHSWLAKMRAPAPTVADKLGLCPGTAVALLLGDQDLETLLHSNGAVISASGNAKLWFVALNSAADLTNLLAQLNQTPLGPTQALWVIRTKGKAAVLKESTVMTELRTLGLTPSKTASVSATQTADRYSRAR
jgi:hypothetical protein